MSREQFRIVAWREAELTQSEAAELLVKESKTVQQLWRQARERFEESRRLSNMYGGYFFSDWRA